MIKFSYSAWLRALHGLVTAFAIATRWGTVDEEERIAAAIDELIGGYPSYAKQFESGKNAQPIAR